MTDKFRVNHWGSHLASNLSVIYARIDGRGSDNRGSKYLHEIYKNMGNVEVMDIITVARYSIFIFILFKFIINKTYFKVSSLFEEKKLINYR